MNDKSIIGFGYKPNFAKAVCLKTNSTTRLGDVEYKIIADPYEREFVELEPVPLSLFGEKKKVLHTAMAVNVLDSVTGLTYAVEYVPANLVRKPKKPQWSDVEITVGGRRLPVALIDWGIESGNRTTRKECPQAAMVEDTVFPKKPGKSTEQRPAVMDSDAFLRRMKEIAQEIDDITDANPDLLGGCSVAFFAANKTNAGLSTNGVSRVCGNPENLVDSISIPAKKNKDIAEVIGKAANKLVAW
ncbi:hypothetical protein [Alistipes putredinis]|uniref:hypothetical protein n=1 Tax=Alistipes putredinis TaxID=28117 RepID=UPI003A8BBBC4